MLAHAIHLGIKMLMRPPLSYDQRGLWSYERGSQSSRDHPFHITSEVSGHRKGVVAIVVPELTGPRLSYDQRRLRSYERGGQYRLGVAKRRPSSEASEASAAFITITFNLFLVALHIQFSLI